MWYTSFPIIAVFSTMIVFVVRRSQKKWPSLRLQPEKVEKVEAPLSREDTARKTALEHASAKRERAAATARQTDKLAQRLQKWVARLAPVAIALGVIASRYHHGVLVATIAAAILVALKSAASRFQRNHRICRQAAEKIGSRIWQFRATVITIEQLLAHVAEEAPAQPLAAAPTITVDPTPLTLEQYVEKRVDHQIAYLNKKTGEMSQVSTRAWWWNIGLGVVKTVLPLVGGGAWMGVVGAAETNTVEDESRIALTLRTLEVLEAVKLRAKLETIELAEAVKLVEEALLLNVGAWFKADPPTTTTPASTTTPAAPASAAPAEKH